MQVKNLLIALVLIFMAGSSFAQSSAITLKAEKKTATAGSKVCVNIYADGFTKMLATQYSVRWDPKVLDFVGVQNFKLPYLTKENFGLTNVKKGFLTVVWIENGLKGADLATGTPMYQLCFTVKGKSGSSSNIPFSPTPTPFEAVNSKEQLAKISVANGSVSVK